MSSSRILDGSGGSAYKISNKIILELKLHANGISKRNSEGLPAIQNDSFQHSQAQQVHSPIVGHKSHPQQIPHR